MRDVETELHRICDFLGEPFEETMLTNRSSVTVPPPAGVTPNAHLEQWRREHYAATLEPVSADSLGKWRSDLRPHEIAMVEGICQRLMRTDGYCPSLPRPARWAGDLGARALEAAGAAEGRARSMARFVWRRAGK